MRALVTGGRGFIGSHIVDALDEVGVSVTVLDNGLSGANENPGADYGEDADENDIRFSFDVDQAFHWSEPDVVFHCAAIARTPWCIEDPVLCYETNVMGTLNVLEAARREMTVNGRAVRVVLSSSNITLAAPTPYWASKRALEDMVEVYSKLYGVSVMALRYSNVYGERQSEEGLSPNVFAAFRKAKRETGRITLTGDGEQTRDFTHVTDIVRGNLLAGNSKWCGVLDLCTGRNVTMNYVARELFGSDVEYIDERVGDVKHIVQDPGRAKEILGWVPIIRLEDGIKDVL